MEKGDKTAERLEMAAVKEFNHTHAADYIDWRVSHIDCLCQWQLVNRYPRIMNCHHGTVAREIRYLVEQYLLSLVEIPLLTCSS